MRKALCIFSFMLLVPAPRGVVGQSLEYEHLSEVFSSVFDWVLTEGFNLSPGDHANHYFPAATRATNDLVPALNSLIASNVASFPMSSNVAGITFDFSSGVPVRVTESLGPIFAETASTLGRRNITFGFNATYLGFENLRGMPLSSMRFGFLHEDVGEPGLGTSSSELDVVNVWLGLDVSASIFAFYATYGVTSNLDIGVALPFVTVSIDGTARAEIDSFTLPAIGRALHFFGGDPLNPVLEDELGYSRSATGLGDVGIRLKYRLPGISSVAALADFRIPTGDELDFLGTGSATARFALIGSHRMGDFTPHVNLGYDYRGADLDSDELEFAVGFDQRISSKVTFALTFLGEVDLNADQAIHLLPGTESITYTDAETGAVATRHVRLSNVPGRDTDHTFRTAIGARFAPTNRLQLLANLLISLSDGGLYSTVSPTVGLSALL